MIAPSLALANLWPAAQPAPAAEASASDSTQTVRRVRVRGQMIVRVPVRPRRASPIRYRLAEGPECLDTDQLAGALIAGKRELDFVMKDRSVMRVSMERSCPSLDFFSGFYLRPEDDRLCMRRDSIRTRMGEECGIAAINRIEVVRAP